MPFSWGAAPQFSRRPSDVAHEIDAEPWGRVARSVEAYLDYARPYGSRR